MTAFMASNKDTIGRMSRSLTSRSAAAARSGSRGGSGGADVQMCSFVFLITLGPHSASLGKSLSY